MKELTYEQAANFFYETCRMDEDDFVQAALQLCEELGIEYESELGQVLDEAIGGTFYSVMNKNIADQFCFSTKEDFDFDIEDLKESFPEDEVYSTFEATMDGRSVFDQDYCIVPASFRLAFEALQNRTQVKAAIPYQAEKER